MRGYLHAEERGPSLRTLLFLHVGNTPPTRLSSPVRPGEEALFSREAEPPYFHATKPEESARFHSPA